MSVERRSREPWFHVILGILRSGRAATYLEIAKDIEEGQKEIGTLINPELLEVEPRWGGHQKLMHSLRRHFTTLRRRGLVEYVDAKRPVRHRITDDGRKWLQEHGY